MWMSAAYLQAATKAIAVQMHVKFVLVDWRLTFCLLLQAHTQASSDFAYGFEQNDFQTPASTQSSLVSLLRCEFYSSAIYYSHLGCKSVLAAVCEQQPSACYPSW